MSGSQDFEQQVTRIHERLEGSGAVVTWSDHITDPDNPARLRQIDITIKREDRLTLVECRIHKYRQNVKWIEELIGRRLSLHADGVIAVSSAGFTKGARAKAAKFGILLRDFQSLSDAEILQWDRSVALTLMFFQYSEVAIGFLFEPECLERIDADRFAEEVKASPLIASAFHKAAELLSQRGIHAEVTWPVKVGFTIVPLVRVYICGEPVAGVEFHACARLISRDVACPSVKAYGRPEILPSARQTVVENYSLGQTSIVHDDAKVSILLDLSLVDKPPLSQFRYARTAGKQEMDFACFEIRGVEALGVSPGPMEIGVGAYSSHRIVLDRSS